MLQRQSAARLTVSKQQTAPASARGNQRRNAEVASGANPITGVAGFSLPVANSQGGASAPNASPTFASPSTKRFAESEGQNGEAGRLATSPTPFTPHGPRPMCADCGRGFYGCHCEPVPDPEIHAAEQRVLASLKRIDWLRKPAGWSRVEL